MNIEIKIPALGESISEATISAIIVSSGSIVSRDQEIVEIETEKVNQVLFAPDSGELKLNVKVGDTVKIGQVIGSVDTSKAASTSIKENKSVVEEKKNEAKEVLPKNEKKESAPASASKSGEEIRKTPQAFVEELKTPIVKNEISPMQNLQLTPQPQIQSGEREERKKMSKIRQTIAKRLVAAKQTMALLTTFNEVDMTAVLELRKKYKDEFAKEHGVKLGFMSFFVKATAAALKEFPAVNAYIDGDDLVYRKYYDINVAISTDRGLVVPVVENCDQLSFAQIEQKIVDLSTKARDGKLTMDEMRSGGFTISNGGVFGSTFSTPIVNPPQSAILGMHRIVERPCAINGQILIRPIMILALSYDHRIIDGQEAVLFLAQIVKAIQDPACLLMDL